MECDYRNCGPYRPVAYKKKDCCNHNELRNEMARGAFVQARSVQPAYLELGKSAVLILYGDSDNASVLSTSAVEDIAEQDGTLQITTRNSVYVMELSGTSQEHSDES